MHAWTITITMPDGSTGRHEAIYTDGCAAVVNAIDLFPNAARISARRRPRGAPAAPPNNPHHHNHPERSTAR